MVQVINCLQQLAPVPGPAEALALEEAANYSFINIHTAMYSSPNKKDPSSVIRVLGGTALTPTSGGVQGMLRPSRVKINEGLDPKGTCM